MSRPFVVSAVRPEELPAAFRLVFQYVAAADREARVANAVRMVESGELDRAGILAVRAVLSFRPARRLNFSGDDKGHAGFFFIK